MEAEISEAIADAAKDENALKVRTPCSPPPSDLARSDSDLNQKNLRKESLVFFNFFSPRCNETECCVRRQKQSIACTPAGKQSRAQLFDYIELLINNSTGSGGNVLNRVGELS